MKCLLPTLSLLLSSSAFAAAAAAAAASEPAEQFQVHIPQNNNANDGLLNPCIIGDLLNHTARAIDASKVAKQLKTVQDMDMFEKAVAAITSQSSAFEGSAKAFSHSEPFQSDTLPVISESYDTLTETLRNEALDYFDDIDIVLRLGGKEFYDTIIRFRDTFKIYDETIVALVPECSGGSGDDKKPLCREGFKQKSEAFLLQLQYFYWQLEYEINHP